MAELEFGPKACQNPPHHRLLHGRTEPRTYVHAFMISELWGLHQAVFSTVRCFCDIHDFVDNDAFTVSTLFLHCITNGKTTEK